MNGEDVLVWDTQSTPIECTVADKSGVSRRIRTGHGNVTELNSTFKEMEE